MSSGHPGDTFKYYNADPFKVIKIIVSFKESTRFGLIRLDF